MEIKNLSKIVVLGAGESGVGAAILAKDKGYQVFVSDFGTISQKYRDMLQAENIDFEEGHHSMDKILEANLVIKSPGIARQTPVMKAIDEKNIKVVSEIEFAGYFTDSRMVCITGSNGKTTTTLLTHHIFTKAGVDAGLAGNVGNSLAWQVAREPHALYVIELSSFQLDDMFDFHANVAVIMNITPDHLDRYDYKMENYVDAKMRILQNMTSADRFIYWASDPVVGARLADVDPAITRLPFDDKHGEGLAACAADGVLSIDIPEARFTVPVKDLALPGVHNLYNSMAAAMAAASMGVTADIITAALADFPGVEHRLQKFATYEGATFINDSKATNVNSTYYALTAVHRPVILILGGKDKGNEYSEIMPLVQEKVRLIIAMGLHNEKIVQVFGRTVDVIDTNSLDAAIDAIFANVRPDDTVLLSPCCASFDLFKNYEDRGHLFMDAVKTRINQLLQ
jgi:UDP-N-acetylmuramoylalanine--D-glutamate ligase